MSISNEEVISLIEGKLNEKNEVIKEQQMQIQDLEGQLEELRAQAGELENLKNQVAEVENLKNQVNDLKTELEEAKSGSSAREQLISEINRVLE